MECEHQGSLCFKFVLVAPSVGLALGMLSMAELGPYDMLEGCKSGEGGSRGVSDEPPGAFVSGIRGSAPPKTFLVSPTNANKLTSKGHQGSCSGSAWLGIFRWCAWPGKCFV